MFLNSSACDHNGGEMHTHAHELFEGWSRITVVVVYFKQQPSELCIHVHHPDKT